MTSPRRARIPALVLPLLILAACTVGGAPATTSTTTTPEPTTTEPPATTTTVPDEPSTTTSSVTVPTTGTTIPPQPSLEVWVDEARAPIVEAAAIEFEAATGAVVEVEVVAFGSIRLGMTQRAHLGEGADVFVGRNDWVVELVGGGIAQPIDLSGRADEFFDVALAAFTHEGSLYGVPFDMEAIGLIRNTALVPEAPDTFEALLQVCDRLAGTVTQCLALPAGDGYHHYPFLAAAGGYLFGGSPATGYDPSDVGIDSEGAVEGFTFLQGLVEEGYLDPAVNYNTMTELFYDGEAAFMWTGPWVLPHLQAAVAEGSLPGYAVGPLPSIDGNPGIPMVGVNGFMVNAFSDAKALAMTFVVDYLITAEVMTELYYVGLRAPAHIAAFEAASADPDVAGFGASAIRGHPTPGIPEMSRVWDALGTAVQAIYDQSGDPAEVLAAAAAVVRDGEAGG